MEIEVSGRKVILRQIAAADTVPLRHSILWPDKPESFVLIPEDDSGLHFGAFLGDDGNGPISVISFFQESLPGAQDTHSPQPAARFRKFATESEYQGQGIGSELLSFATNQVKAMWGVNLGWCDARVSAMGWYVKRGMHELGGNGNAIFFKEHIPYLKMGMEV
ncbi:hypothetical protein M407DRAFT_245229 [Tulasnella calospora MUT 4182]|uniref:N-acetyltransferase domain-containing protein n=1 Tax=Tulasnella calospora MUT 4182 TaxID=1051891 RepID=A0A0C3LLQ0_9AGAM|nr:hypothetical protein M407DRAFT_245229 [Tulasnella calospora MUT 4182]